MSRLREQGGFTLPELLTAMLIFMFVLGATLTTLDGFVTRASTDTKANDAQDQARFTIERIVRQMRNLASPVSSSVKSIDRATPYDLVFQTVDPSLRRIRYCLDSAPASNATLWVQTQAFPLSGADPGMPLGTQCPAGGWTTERVGVPHVVNRIGGDDRPLFTYNVPAGSDTAKITGIRAELFLDVNSAAKAPAETNIASGDFLRNQNQPPLLPDFEMTQSPAGSRHFILNGSEASDPEGRTLEYIWYKGTGNTADLPACTDNTNQTGGGFTCIGRGLTLSYTFGTPGVKTVTLKVVDPGGLSAVLSKNTPALP